MWPWKSSNRSPEYKYASDKSKYQPHPHLGFQVSHRMMQLMVGCLCFGVLLILINIYQLRSLNAGLTVGDPDFGSSTRPVVWMNGKNLRSGYLKHVIAVFSRVGYTRTEMRNRLFDVMWAHDYPFGGELKDMLQTLEPHQKINHFPGSGFITNKVSLAVNHFQFIPPAFVIPKNTDKFLEEVKTIPRNCGWKRATITEEYTSKLQKRKFDIGIYTVLTSIDPLRVYVYDQEVLIRFCEKDYYPFDADVEQKYVVEDSYTQPWELPSLRELWNKGKYSRKMLLNAYLKQQGKDVNKMWNDAYRAIAEVYLRKEPDLISAASHFKSTRNFFEMVRFDFILDADLKVWLMEVNMSPNLSSAAHSDNKLMYEQVIFNLLGLVGVATKLDHSLKYSSPSEKDMLVSDQDIQVLYETCASKECTKACFNENCRLCYSCLRENERDFIKAAYLEHTQRGGFRRVYPPVMTSTGEARKDSPALSLSSSNQLMFQWFKTMCLHDISWCA
ncbi:Tubulin-tyrosine ligase [Desmophyllum pertusum]|uniref:Tubulin-tyrosine ligase n=1 Tax=Desmophyllum pertusum TaxID=174260 RepID=A0A9X0D313_9CNID|nr:Tubulin-tyrosine ligase [Desmophyllum pertusum]